MDMKPRRHPLAIGEALQTIPAGIEKSGQTAATLTQGPLQERIMAAQDDAGALAALTQACAFRMLLEPGIHSITGKQQLAGGARARDFAGCRHVVDLAFLEAQQICELLGGEVTVHSAWHPRSLQTYVSDGIMLEFAEYERADRRSQRLSAAGTLESNLAVARLRGQPGSGAARIKFQLKALPTSRIEWLRRKSEKA